VDDGTLCLNVKGADYISYLFSYVLMVIIELFSLSVTAETLQNVKLYSLALT